jgi:RHS repeat-associated protein
MHRRWQTKKSARRHMRELPATNNALVRSYVWGLDLSGTLEVAGGVGGLLWISNFQSPIGTHFVGYDGNGNVVALVSAATGTETARYEYGPFGEPIRLTGPAANLNPFRFSTKRTCNTTDLVLYEYRAYSPTRGGWLSRDPIGDLRVLFNLSYITGQLPSQLPHTREDWLRKIREYVQVQSFAGECTRCMQRITDRLTTESISEGPIHERNLYLFVINSATVFVDPLGLKAYVCIRPLNFPVLCKTWLFVHCFIKTDECGNWNFNDKGVGEEPNPGGVCGQTSRCVPIDCECLDEKKLCQTIANSKTDPAWAPGTWTLTGHNCCHWVDMILKKDNCKGVAKHFPGYWLPPANPAY